MCSCGCGGGGAEDDDERWMDGLGKSRSTSQWVVGVDKKKTLGWRSGATRLPLNTEGTGGVRRAEKPNGFDPP